MNVFQKTMLQWNSMYPYNAVHVLFIPGIPNEPKLRQVLSHALDRRGFTGFIEMRDLGSADTAVTLIIPEITQQLNTAFPLKDSVVPFRFFVARQPDAFALGLTYLHAVADAQSIVFLLQEIRQKYASLEAMDAPAAPDLQGAQFPPALLSHAAAFAWKLASLPGFLSRMRHSCRPAYRDPADLKNGFAFFSLPGRDLSSLVRTARLWGVTVNDVLLAILLKICAGFATGREQATRRNQLSIGCIVNTRPEFGERARGAFGLFLGSFILTHPVPNQITLRQLAQDVGRTTIAIKRRKLYLATPLELSLGRLLLSFFSTARRKKLYQKHYPLWGGLTNMNLNTVWSSTAGTAPMDYLRAVSTGPATPLVVSFTTVGDKANVGLSYRSTVYSSDDAGRIVRLIRELSASLEGID